MGIVNKRNAVLGWLTWQAGKRVAKKKARDAVPSVEGGKPNKSATVAILAGLGGAVGSALWLWRRQKGEDTPDVTS